MPKADPFTESVRQAFAGDGTTAPHWPVIIATVLVLGGVVLSALSALVWPHHQDPNLEDCRTHTTPLVCTTVTVP